MPVHDWTKVSAGTFHNFHNLWIAQLCTSLNNGVLPAGYYAMGEQVAGETIPDVLTLSTIPRNSGSEEWQSNDSGVTAVAEAPPKVRYTLTLDDEASYYALKRRTLVIRHTSGDEIVALIEIVSPGNKGHRAAMDAILDKVVAALQRGFHVLLIDLFPPGRFDPSGIHVALWQEFYGSEFHPPKDKPLTLAAYPAGVLPTAYVEPVAVGDVLPDMPLFLKPGWYVKVPLESTYREAWRGVPERWRQVIEAK